MNRNETGINPAADGTGPQTEDPVRNRSGESSPADVIGDAVDVLPDVVESVLDGSASAVVEGAINLAGDAVGTVLEVAGELLGGIFG